MSKSRNSKFNKKSSELAISNYSHVNDTMKIIYGTKDAVAKGVEFMQKINKKMDLCYDSNAPSIVLNVDQYKNGYVEIRKRGGKIRVITEVTKENIEYCKELMNIVDEIRHLDNIKGGTAISETEYMATNILHESKPLAQVVYSNVIDVVEQQQNFFDSLWKIATPAKQKIREITSKSNQQNIDIFSALDNEIRRSMIFYLSEQNMTFSQLAKKLNMTLQALQKHFPKLIELDIIEKKSDGNVSLTELGYVVAKQIPSIQFLFENREYFKTRYLSLIPTQFLQRLGDLQEFEIISGKEQEKFNTFFHDSEEFVKLIILKNYFKLEFPTVSKLMKKGVKISHISDNNTVSSTRWQNLTKKLESEKSMLHGSFKGKTAKNISIILGVSDKSACLGFLNHDGTVDDNNLMFSRNQDFISWCINLFDYVWNKT